MKCIALVTILIPPLLFAQNADKSDNAKQQNTQIIKIDSEDDSALQRHYPFYFIYGEPLSKVQLSFKSPIIRKVPVYFAYTQVMFWALNEESKPFRDLTYSPEIFYRWSGKSENRYFESLDLGFWGHHSNGKNEEDSRSYDKQYVRLNFAHEGHRWVTRFGAEIAYIHNFDVTNSDLREFIGPMSLFISFVQLFENKLFDKGEVRFKASPGGEFSQNWDRGGYQISYSFRLGKQKLFQLFIYNITVDMLKHC